uniref:Protein Wnt n=1 Tax=Acrobeloides nanus TaxID=290746 RepID=A0A914EDK3_9BILA
MISTTYILNIFLLFVLFVRAQPFNWLSLAMSATSNYAPDSVANAMDKKQYQLLCQRLPGLNPIQKVLCEQHPLTIPSIGRSAKESVYECQMQFKFDRWNCSERYEVYQNLSNAGFTFRDLLGKTLRSGNRESAFISAITSAGIVHAVTRGCSSGNLTECGCSPEPSRQRYIDVIDNNLDSLQANSQVRSSSFAWGGCSDDTTFAVKFARDFLDKFEYEQFRKTNDTRYLMNAITQNMRRQCRCHGVSGSCELKTCWLQMPKFSEVGEMLKKRYSHFAVQVAKRSKRRLRRKERSERQIPLRGNEMAYIYRSPSYCERNDSMGILGTHNRECNPTSLGADSCDLLCCGRGYNTREEVRTVRCQCKFVWCCHVKCKECTEIVQIHTCK